MVTYIPSRGDIVWINFNPQAGHEQAGRRPAFVISSKSYNQKTGLALLCPITSRIKNYPFEIEIRSKNIQGVILSDQIRSFDWNARNASFEAHLNAEIFYTVRENLFALLQET